MIWSKLRRSDYLAWSGLAALNGSIIAVLWMTGRWLYSSDRDPWDYVAQWAAGSRVLSGEAWLVYDWEAHAAYQAHLIGAAEPIQLYIFYPPHFLFVTPIFSWLQHEHASVAFLVVTAFGYAASLYLLLKSWLKASLIAVSGGGALYSVWWTQNGFLTAALMTAGLVLLRTRPILAGVFFGLLTIKPQLGFLVPVALLFSGSWATAGSALATFLMLGIIAEAVLGAGIWETFLSSALRATDFIESGALVYKQQSVFAIARIFYTVEVAWLVHSVLVIAVVAMIAWMWSTHSSHWTRSSALVSASLLVTPYLYPYDAVMLTAAAAMLLHGEDESQLSGWERGVVFGCCLGPMAAGYIFSAAIPLSALGMLYIAVRRQGKWERRRNPLVPDASPLPPLRQQSRSGPISLPVQMSAGADRLVRNRSNLLVDTIRFR